MKKKLINQLWTFLAILGIVMLQSCTYDEVILPEVEVPDTVSFELDVIPIFEMNCNSSTCHASGAVPPDLTPPNAWVNLTFFGYLDTANAPQSELYLKIDGGSMEKFASDQDRALILEWIEQGGQNN